MRLWTSGTLSPQGSKVVIWVTLVRPYKQIVCSNPEEFVNAPPAGELPRQITSAVICFRVWNSKCILYFFHQMRTWNG
jgi:hypothetical protein